MRRVNDGTASGSKAAVLCIAASLAACAAPDLPPPSPPSPVVAPLPPPPPRAEPRLDEIFRQARILRPARPLECVEYVRDVTGVAIRGNAWTWWDAAAGRYARGMAPHPGAVLVFRKQLKSVGHVAVVKRVVTDRLIVVDHADWLKDGRIYADSPVMDVSERGDWSAVRVWYTPGRSWGRRVYRTYGFIYVNQRIATQ
jgi:surface antigen